MLESYATTFRRGLLGSFVEKSFEMEKERMDKYRRGERERRTLHMSMPEKRTSEGAGWAGNVLQQP